MLGLPPQDQENGEKQEVGTDGLPTRELGWEREKEDEAIFKGKEVFLEECGQEPVFSAW